MKKAIEIRSHTFNVHLLNLPRLKTAIQIIAVTIQVLGIAPKLVSSPFSGFGAMIPDFLAL